VVKLKSSGSFYSDTNSRINNSESAGNVMTQVLSRSGPIDSSKELMSAVVIVEPMKAELVQVPIPEPGPGEVRIRVQGCGVCASNLPPWEGRPWFKYPMEPGALGHEGWGYIDAIGTGVKGFNVGDHVTMLSYHAYAQYDIAASSAVVKLPVSLVGTPFPGEPLSCAVNIFKRADIREGQTLTIVGIGFLGSLLVQLACGAGANVVAIDRRPCALEIAKEFGAQKTIQLNENYPVIEQVSQWTNGEFCDRVIEATGKQNTLDLATEITKIRGKLIIAGYHQDGLRQVNMQLWNWRGLDVINAHERDPQVYIDGLHAAVEAVEQGKITPHRLLTHNYPLTQFADALNGQKERAPGFMKAITTLSL
jgi:threonine dehydrogenase-like Zn-dependent dehydrogenase